MGASEEAAVRRLSEDMNNGRKLDLADELFTTDHVFHDPQVPAGPGPRGMADVVRTYQEALDGHWQIEEIFSAGDRVVVRWTGSGTRNRTLNGIRRPASRSEWTRSPFIGWPATGIAETWEVWDTLGLLQQIGVVPAG